MWETTDDQNELFDLVTEDDQVIGQIARAAVHADKSLIHRAVGAYVFDKRGRLLIQQRSLTKDTSPGAWALSVGGHVGTGGTAEAAIAREIEEELGRRVMVWPVAKKLVRLPAETEWWYLFAGMDSGPWPEVNPEEVMQVKYATLAEVREMIKDEQVACSPAMGVVVESWELAWKIVKTSITSL